MLEPVETKALFISHTVDPETVGRYTGLKDQHNEPIFEDDIVKLQLEVETKTPYVSQVYFHPAHGAMVSSHPVHMEIGIGPIYRQLVSYCVDRPDRRHCEVIGNIHDDDPELLEATYSDD